jgi:hypothetical protein
LGGPIIGPIFLDPGSLAYDSPERYEYKLTFRNLEEYIEALSEPSWHQWLNHETKQLDKEQFIELIFESIEYSINQREKYGVYSESMASTERLKAKINRIAVGEVDKIVNLQDKVEKESKLKSLKSGLDILLSSYNEKHTTNEK